MGLNSWFEKFRERKLGQTMVVYLGSAWVFIEALNFLVNQYRWDTDVIDVAILLILFGFPAVIIYSWFDKKLTFWSVSLLLTNLFLAISVISINIINPKAINPTQLRLLRFKEDQKKLAEAINSLVILPFENYTGLKDFEYYTAGMHSALIGDMGKVGALTVISRTSSKKFQNTSKTIPEIANELDVDAVLETSIASVSEDSVCIVLTLFSAYPEEKQLWNGKFYAQKKDIETLLNDVTKKVSNELNIVLTPQEEILLSKARDVNPDAYEAYLRGMSYWELGKRSDLEKAREYFELSLRIDPDYALAHLGISKIYGGLAQHGFISSKDAIEKAEESMMKAVALDSNLVEVRTHLANRYAWNWWDWENAGKEFKKAMNINPNYPFAVAYYAHYLMVTGNVEKGLEMSKKAVKIDPLNSLYKSVYGMSLKNARKYDEALDLLEEIYSNIPDQGIALPALWAVYHELGRYDDAYELALLVLKNKQGREEMVMVLEEAYNEEGYMVAMKKVAHAMENSNREIYIPAWQVFTQYCRAGMKENALSWLEKAYNDQDPNLGYISIDPLFDFLRKDEKFKEILNKVGLPEIDFN